MRTIEEILEKLASHCATRGAAAKLSRDLDVAKSTVTRWQEEKTIPEAMQKLLAWYLLGEAPPSFSRKINLRDALVFEDDEWRIIAYLAKRAGITEAAWIVRHVRDYLSMLDEKKSSADVYPPSLKIVAADPAEYKITRKPHLQAAAGSPLLSEVQDWDGEDDTVLVKINGLSMYPLFTDGEVISMKHKRASRTPHVAKGKIYLFAYDGGYLVKRYNTRVATQEEIDAGLSYVSPTDRKPKVRILQSVNTAFGEIVLKDEAEWIAWLPKK